MNVSDKEARSPSLLLGQGACSEWRRHSGSRDARPGQRTRRWRCPRPMRRAAGPAAAGE